MSLRSLPFSPEPGEHHSQPVSNFSEENEVFCPGGEKLFGSMKVLVLTNHLLVEKKVLEKFPKSSGDD